MIGTEMLSIGFLASNLVLVFLHKNQSRPKAMTLNRELNIAGDPSANGGPQDDNRCECQTIFCAGV